MSDKQPLLNTSNRLSIDEEKNDDQDKKQLWKKRFD